MFSTNSKYILRCRHADAADFVPDRQNTYLPLDGGTLFDLGGVTLEPVYVPGHTQGMLCILNREERSLLMGDACNPSVFLWDEESSCVEDYLKSLRELKKLENRWDCVYLSHGQTRIGKEILDGVIMVCEEILRNENDWEPFYFLGHELRLTKKETDGVRPDGGLGNIVYNPQKIIDPHRSLTKE